MSSYIALNPPWEYAGNADVIDSPRESSSEYFLIIPWGLTLLPVRRLQMGFSNHINITPFSFLLNTDHQSMRTSGPFIVV